MKQPVLLAYNMEGERLKKAAGLCMRLKIRLRIVESTEFGRPLASLVGRENKGAEEPAAQNAFSDEMLVMAFFPRPLLSLFLDTWRKEGMSPVALKAVLTETNSQWHSRTLHRELSEEAAWFRENKQALHPKV